MKVIKNTNQHLRSMQAVPFVGVILFSPDLQQVGLYESCAGKEGRCSFPMGEVTTADILRGRGINDGVITSAAESVLLTELGVEEQIPLAYIGTFFGACSAHRTRAGQPCEYHMLTGVVDEAMLVPDPEVVRRLRWKKTHEVFQDVGQDDMSAQKRMVTRQALSMVVPRVDYLIRKLRVNLRRAPGFKKLRQKSIDYYPLLQLRAA